MDASFGAAAVIVLLLFLVLFLIIRNKKDLDDLKRRLNDDYPKPEKTEPD
jgi:hypothetical protein